jgi:hypothetical protein
VEKQILQQASEQEASQLIDKGLLSVEKKEMIREQSFCEGDPDEDILPPEFVEPEATDEDEDVMQ